MRHILCLVLISCWVRCGDLGSIMLSEPAASRPARSVHDMGAGDTADSNTSPRHHHLSITIDRDSPVHEDPPDIAPNRLRYKLAIVSAISGIIAAGLTATITILTMKRSCP